MDAVFAPAQTGVKTSLARIYTRILSPYPRRYLRGCFTRYSGHRARFSAGKCGPVQVPYVTPAYAVTTTVGVVGDSVLIDLQRSQHDRALIGVRQSLN
ncbi:hypothetical protein EVAR_21378_1 [Eumeta japonica]|uniref:Uncharacterized protein n=1 Tax=Eumeta variegata TaxID=151549 RepID=A0A4C1VGS9_EUMVA|nr:hypothetical protein EVAR_21378_1 [Eumeta japonica]